jgi:hypothetical protein
MLLRLLPLVLVGSLVRADDQPTEKQDLAALSQALQKVIAGTVPREIEDRSGWGTTVPVEPNMRFLNLRTIVKVGDKDELPHGSWSRSKGTIPDPDKDIQITVRELKSVEDNKQRLVVDVDIHFAWEHERKVWSKGIQLAGITAAGTSRSRTQVTCEFGTTLDVTVFPPLIKVDAVIKGTKTELREFELTKLTNIPLISEAARKHADEIRPLLQAMISRKEKELTPALNAALADALKKK